MNGYKQVTVSDRQSLTDIAMQEYGCYQGVFILLEDNSDRLFAIDEVPLPGMKLNVRTTVPNINAANTSVVAEYGKQDHRVLSQAVGEAFIVEVVSDYVTTDYMDITYSQPPAHITGLKIMAAIPANISINNTNNTG